MFKSFWEWIIVLAIFELILKGVALWRSARRSEKGWFIAILIINSVGIVPGIYLLTHPEESTKVEKKKKK